MWNAQACLRKERSGSNLNLPHSTEKDLVEVVPECCSRESRKDRLPAYWGNGVLVKEKNVQNIKFKRCVVGFLYLIEN